MEGKSSEEFVFFYVTSRPVAFLFNARVSTRPRWQQREYLLKDAQRRQSGDEQRDQAA